ncbi:MAG: tetratricopeptide repeat protein [Alphaproteobacteria bacterium]|nr:tetratricopeptide repeat protein [Alphaproteobacteria bacterium]
MPIIFLATVGVQILCIVHAVRTGRTQPWLYVIMFLPLVGSVAYFLVEILPGIADTRRARNVLSNVQTVLDPDREYRDRLAQVELSGTPAAKAALADECSRKGMHDDAVALYRTALTGLFADDPNLLLGFARVLVEKPDFAECQRTLDHLRDKNPDFNSSDGHLLYARALEGQLKSEEAAAEYEALIGYYPGYEAKVRYAIFLQKLGQPAKAKEVLEGVVKSYKQQPRHAQALNRDWYDVARRNLEGRA